MRINFEYEKKKIEYSWGYVFKGKNYRCSLIKYPTLYKNPAPGTETVEVYNFSPKTEAKASVLIIQGLGSRNVYFLLWMATHLASSGVNTSVLILPGNFTRVEHGSVSGKSYLWPDIKVMYQFWEHGIVDTLTTIDLLQQQNLWKQNNCVLGYCLGGMIATIIMAFEKRINQTILMTVGGHFPKIIFESSATAFARKLFAKGFETDYYLNDKEKLFKIYKEQFPKVRKMRLTEILNSTEIYPLFKIDPLSYAHLIDKERITFINAIFDKTLPLESRKMLARELKGSKIYNLPIGHTIWLPFEYVLARYILHKVNVYDRKVVKKLLIKEEIEDPLDEDTTIK